MADIGVVAASFQFAGQLWQVIEKIDDLQKRFREAKSDHKEDSDEIWNILQAVEYSSKSYYYISREIGEIAGTARVTEMLKAIDEKASNAKDILTNNDPKSLRKRAQYIREKANLDKIKQQMYRLQTTISMVNSFTQLKSRQLESQTEATNPSTNEDGKTPATGESKIYLEKLELDEMRKVVEKAVQQVLQRTKNEEESLTEKEKTNSRGAGLFRKGVTNKCSESRDTEKGIHERIHDSTLELRSSILDSNKSSIENRFSTDNQATPNLTQTPLTAADILSASYGQDQNSDYGPAPPPDISEITPSKGFQDLTGNPIYRKPCGCLEDQAQDTMISVLGLQPPVLHSSKNSGDEPEIFWKGTSFASLMFGSFSTMVFFQSSNGWIQCGVIPDPEDDGEDEDEEYKGLVLLEPVALAAMGSPLVANFLEPDIIGLFYTAERQGTEVICEHRLVFHPERPFLWSAGKLEQLGIPTAPSTRIFWIEDEREDEWENYICFEEAGGKLVYLQYDLSEDRWVRVTGPQPPSDLLHNCPLGIQLEKESLKNEEDKVIKTVKHAHHFFYRYPSTSEDEYIMTQIKIRNWEREQNTPAGSHRSPINMGDQVQPWCSTYNKTEAEEIICFLHSTPDVIYREQFLNTEPRTETSRDLHPQILCKKKEGTQFYMSGSLNGIIYVSELGKMALLDMRHFTPSEDHQYIPLRSKILFSGGFTKGTISDVKLWLRMGWRLERSVHDDDCSCEDCEHDEGCSCGDCGSDDNSDEEGSTSQESSIAAQKQITACDEPQRPFLLPWTPQGASD